MKFNNFNKWSKKVNSPMSIGGMPIGQVVILSGVAVIAASVLIGYHYHSQNISDQNTALSTTTAKTNPTIAVQPASPPAPITASSIVTLLNQERVAKGLTAFKWITQLDNAAVARANYMVANKTTSVTFGDPTGDLTTAGYNYRNAEWNDTWNQTTTQGVVDNLTTGNNSNLGFSTAYSDIGVGIVPDTVVDNSTELIFVYLANQATGTSYSDNYIPPPIDTYVAPTVNTYTYTAPPVPTCNTTMQVSYENSYESQYQSLMEQESNEIQSVQEQMAIDGAGDSSAYNAVPSEVAEQFDSQFSAIKETLDSELISIDCTT